MSDQWAPVFMSCRTEARAEYVGEAINIALVHVFHLTEKHYLVGRMRHGNRTYLGARNQPRKDLLDIAYRALVFDTPWLIGYEEDPGEDRPLPLGSRIVKVHGRYKLHRGTGRMYSRSGHTR